MIKLLFVEDNYDFACTIQEELQEVVKGYQVEVAFNGLEGLEKWKDFCPNIIVSDIDMPIMDGMQMVEHIRETDTAIPILFTSGLTSKDDVVNGYRSGANNYIKKPFGAEELDAHIQSVLRMTRNPKWKDMSLYEIGSYTFYPQYAKLYNNKTKGEKNLTKLETVLLTLFAEKINEVVPIEVLLKARWNVDNEYFASRCLHTHIYNLRKYFKDDRSVNFVSLKSIGYILNVH